MPIDIPDLDCDYSAIEQRVLDTLDRLDPHTVSQLSKFISAQTLVDYYGIKIDPESLKDIRRMAQESGALVGVPRTRTLWDYINDALV